MTADAQALPSLQRVTLERHVLDLGRHVLMTHEGQAVPLRPQSLELLCHLAAQPGKVFTKAELMEALWPRLVVTEDSLVHAVGDVRRALSDASHEVLQTVPRRGYRLVASTSKLTAPVQGSTSLPPTRRWRWMVVSAIGSALVGALLAIFLAWHPVAPAHAGHFGIRFPLAVLGSAGGTAEEELLSQSYAYELVSELSQYADLSVVASQYSTPPDSGPDSVHALAQNLGVRYLVGISLQREPEGLRLRAQLLDGQSGQVLWAHSEDVETADVLKGRHARVQNIAASVRADMRLSEPPRRT